MIYVHGISVEDFPIDVVDHPHGNAFVAMVRPILVPKWTGSWSNVAYRALTCLAQSRIYFYLFNQVIFIMGFSIVIRCPGILWYKLSLWKCHDISRNVIRGLGHSVWPSIETCCESSISKYIKYHISYFVVSIVFGDSLEPLLPISSPH